MASFDESFFVANQASNLDDFTVIFVVEHLEGLRSRDAPCQELDEISRLENDVGIGSLFGSADGHAAFHQVEFAGDGVLVEGLGDDGPDFAEVLFAVFGEERGEGGLFEEAAAGEGVLGGVPGGDGPVVDGWVVPWLVAAVFVVVFWGGWGWRGGHGVDV